MQSRVLDNINDFETKEEERVLTAHEVEATKPKVHFNTKVHIVEPTNNEAPPDNTMMETQCVDIG